MSLRILVVDDAVLMRHSIRLLLADMGYEVAGEAVDGEDACRQYEQVRPDLVMMDVVMPGVDGIEALRRIREMDPAARVVMVTAVDHQASILEAFRLGAIDYLVKPFERDRVEEALQRASGHAPATGPLCATP